MIIYNLEQILGYTPTNFRQNCSFTALGSILIIFGFATIIKIYLGSKINFPYIMSIFSVTYGVILVVLGILYL